MATLPDIAKHNISITEKVLLEFRAGLEQI